MANSFFIPANLKDAKQRGTRVINLCDPAGVKRENENHEIEESFAMPSGSENCDIQPKIIGYFAECQMILRGLLYLFPEAERIDTRSATGNHCIG